MKQRKIIIIGLFKFPHGDANANYQQYLSQALINAGYKVELLSYINSEYASTDFYEYKGIAVKSVVKKSKDKLLTRLYSGKLFPYMVYKLLKKQNLTQNDLLFIPRGVPAIYNAAVKLRKKIGFRIACCPLEWFGKEEYVSLKEYYKAEKEFQALKNVDVLFPISYNIANQFPKNKKLVLPMMTDVSEYSYFEKKYGKYQFIFPTNGKMKDSIIEMLRGIALLDEGELSRVTFHFTGIKKEIIDQALNCDEKETILKSIVLHPWLKYDELVELFRKMHYLFLARPINQMTLSNFPSKVPEVMTHGVVPVVTRVGDYTQFYLRDDVDSLIFEGCSSEKCAEVIRRAINIPFDKYQRMSRNARKCAEERFDYHNWISQIKSVLEEI